MEQCIKTEHRSYDRSIRLIGYVAALLGTYGGVSQAEAQCAFDSNPTEIARLGQYTPMSAHDRWCSYVKQNFTTPGVAIRTFGAGLGEQLGTKPPEWGGGVNGYFHRTGSELGRFTMQGTIQASMAAGLHQDTRYIPCHCTGISSRALHAVGRNFLTYGERGQRQLDVSGLSGIYGSSMLSIYWYPGHYSPLVQGVQGGHGGVAIQTGLNLLKEFSPELARPFRLLTRRHDREHPYRGRNDD